MNIFDFGGQAVSKDKSLNEYIEKATVNVEQDRAITKQLLDDILQEVANKNHGVLDSIAAKYLETLQRSNEQLIKLAAIIQKQQSQESEDLNSSDVEGLLDQIQDDSNRE